MTFPAAGDLAVLGTARFICQLTMTQIPVTFWIGIVYISDERYSQPPATSNLGSFNELALSFSALTPIAEGEAILCDIIAQPFGLTAINAIPLDGDLEQLCPMIGKLFASVGLPTHAAFLKRLPELYAHIWDIDADAELLPKK